MQRIIKVADNTIEIDVDQTRILFTKEYNIQCVIEMFEKIHDAVLCNFDDIIYKIDASRLRYSDIMYFNECKDIIIGIQDEYSTYISSFIVTNAGVVTRCLYNMISIFILQEMKNKIRFIVA